MQIQSITLKNIGPFKDLTIPFAPLETDKPKVTVFIGNNGSGKTNILKSVVTALSWLPARIRTKHGRGSDIPELVINNDKTSALVSIAVSTEQNEYEWTLSKTRKGKINQFSNNFKDVTALAEKYRNHFTKNKNVNLPLIVFYPVERSVLDVPLRIRKLHKFEQLNAYDNALDMGVDFRCFFEWFRNEENKENAIKSYFSDFLEKEYNQIVEIDKKISPLLNQLDLEPIQSNLSLKFDIYKKIKEIKEKQNHALHDIKNLTIVKNAIKTFTDFDNIRIQSSPLRMVLEKQGKKLNVFQLSQGEKALMALVGDIARRLSMLNPDLENPLEGQGIVIIDEADLHLHPQWQRQLVARLTQTFPNCQFILSTHSPLIISDSKDIVVYSLENGEMIKIPSQYGQDANTVYLDAMDTAIRNEEVTKKLDDLLNLIQDNKLNEAKVELAELKKKLPPNHLELVKAQFLLKKQEARHEKN